MGINIDEFLNDFVQDNKKIKKVDDKIDLSFQKDVEDKLQTVNQKSNNTKLNFLEKAYTQVKKFDEDLPNKFLGIENKGNEILVELGNKYSTKIIKNIEYNLNLIQIEMKSKFKIIDEQIKLENFEYAINNLENIGKKLITFPIQFSKFKNQLKLEIIQKEIEINKKLKIFKINEIKKLKRTSNLNILNLKKSLIPQNYNKIKFEIEKLKIFSDNIPKIFYSELIEEKKLISKTKFLAEKYLFEEYNKEFKIKNNNIEKLIEEFHRLKLEKKIEEILIIYNEIIIEFNSIPELFYEEKIRIFKNINGLFSSINSLIVKNNLSTFYETYNHGKIIEEVREYLDHIFITKKVNKLNLLQFQKKLKEVPRKYFIETKDLDNKINKILKIYNDKELKIKQNKTKYQSSKNLKTEEKSNEIKTEINHYYLKLKNTSDPKELKLYYNKLIFYLKLINTNKENKRKLLLKFNEVINSKKLKYN